MADRYISEARRLNFQAKGDFLPDKLRSDRQEETTMLREQNRMQILAEQHSKQGGEGIGLGGGTAAATEKDDDDDDDDDDDTSAVLSELMNKLPHMMKGIFSDQVEEQTQAVTDFRKLLSKRHSPGIDDGIEAQVIARFVELLRSPYAAVQLESAWALTNIVAGSTQQTKSIIEAGAVPIFVELLHCPDLNVREQAVWALGNIAGQSTSCRDFVLGANALGPLLSIIDMYHHRSMLRNATWTLSNLCRGTDPQPTWDKISPAVPALARLVYMQDDEVLIDACWAICYLCNISDGIKAVIEAKIPCRLVELLMHTSPFVQKPALRTVGAIFTGDATQAQAMIEYGLLPTLRSLLSSPDEGTRKDVCWAISTITAGNASQIQAVFDAGIMTPLIDLLGNGETDIRKAACWAVCNATSDGLQNSGRIERLVSQGCIKPLCDLLTFPDNPVIQIALDGLQNILEAGKADMDASHGDPRVNRYALWIEDAGGMEKIRDCQYNANEAIYRKAYAIIDGYFDDGAGAGDADTSCPQ